MLFQKHFGLSFLYFSNFELKLIDRLPSSLKVGMWFVDFNSKFKNKKEIEIEDHNCNQVLLYHIEWDGTGCTISNQMV